MEMGLLKHLPAGIFVFLAMAVGASAVAVNTNHKALEVYDKHVKETLESLEFLFTVIGNVYFVLPMICFTVVSDWTKTFFDCFSPMTLWMDAVYSAVVIVHFILFLGDIHANLGRIICEYEGLGLLLSCIYAYVMLKSSTAGSEFSRKQATIQNIGALLFLVGFGLVTVLQLQFNFIVPQGYSSKIAGFLTALGIITQGLQPLISVLFRCMKGGNFDDDAQSTRNTKVAAATVRVITLTYDVWLCSSKGYLKTPNRSPFAIMICTCLAVSWVQLFYRYLGPRKVKAIIDWLWDKDFEEKVRQRSLSTSADIHMKTLSRTVITRL